MPEPVLAIAAIGGAAQASSANKAAKRSGNAANAQAALAQEQAAIAREQWDNYKETYLPFIKEQLGDSREDREFYETEIRPIEQMQIDSVNDDREEFAAGQASSAVDKQYGIAREGESRRLQAYGVDPTSARSIGENRRSANEMAASKASVVNNARIDERDRIFNRRSAITNMGRVNRTAMQGPNIPTSPGSISSAFGSAANSFGNAANSNLNYANTIGRDAGRLAGGISNIFLQRQKSGSFGGGIGGLPTSGAYGGVGVGASGAASGAVSSAINSIGFAEGGYVESPGMGREIEGPGDEESDSIPALISDNQGGEYPAKLSDGEYVLPADVVKYHGTKFLDELVKKVKNKTDGNQQYGLQRGVA